MIKTLQEIRDVPLKTKYTLKDCMGREKGWILKDPLATGYTGTPWKVHYPESYNVDSLYDDEWLFQSPLNDDKEYTWILGQEGEEGMHFLLETVTESKIIKDMVAKSSSFTIDVSTSGGETMAILKGRIEGSDWVLDLHIKDQHPKEIGRVSTI